MNPWLCNLLFNNSGGSSLPATGQTFYASLKTSLVPEMGTGGPTWSRATAAWRFNDLGYLRQIPSGCAEFGGARLVTNLCPTPSNTLAVAGTKTVTLTAAATLQFSMGAGTGTATFSGTGGATGTLAAGASRVRVNKTVTAGTFIVTASVADLVDLSIVDVTGRDASYIPEYVSVGSTVGKNFFLHTDDFSQSSWNKTNITITQTAIANPVNGRVDAQKVEATTSASTSMYQSCASIGLAAGNVFSVYVKHGSGATDANKFVLRNSTTATNLLWVTLNYSTGEITYVTGSDGASAVALSNGWWKITLAVTSGVSDGNTLVGYIGFGGPSETAGEFLYAYRPYLGQGTTAPAVIPVVAGVWDPHGSGADGSKYFTTDWQGAPIPVANLTRLRKESSATNALLWSRDLSNASWSTKTNITTEKTATGLDGIANTATTLTATATNAIILQPTSGIASAARCASAYVLRKVGTGTISFTQDGGSTWTDITTQLNTSMYSRVQITATLANPSVGFKISTSGDAIEVDCVQNEAGSVATSPIVTTTTTVARNTDAVNYLTSGNVDFTEGTCYALLKSSGSLLTRYGVSVGADGYSYINSAGANTSWGSYDGTNILVKTGLDDMTAGAMVKRAVAWGGSTQKVTGNGATPASGAFDGSWGSGATINIANTLLGNIGDIAIYNYKMTDAELQAITT